jgi:hypothetical protein
LVLVMLIMVGLLGLGLTAMWLTTGNLQVGANINQRTQALYVAEAGIERAREILNGPVPPDIGGLLAGSNPGSDNVPTGVDPVTGLPNGVGAILVDTAGIALQDVAYPPASFARSEGESGGSTAVIVGRYTVWIRNDTGECRQNLFTRDANGAVVVRSRGMASDGRTNVVLEVSLGPSGRPGEPGRAGPAPPVLCNSGKNACDDNSSTQFGIVAN